MKVRVLLLSLIVLSVNVWAAKPPAKRGCEPALVPAANPGSLSNPKHPGYAKVAREEGLEFLMINVSYENFLELLQAVQQGEVKVMATGSGIAGIAGQAMGGISEPSSRFNHSMIGLHKGHVGHWAHQLIGNGSDSIGMGFRGKSWNNWSVGMVFPVELLDFFEFEITGSGTVEERKAAMTFGRSRAHFESASKDLERFRRVISDKINNPPYPDSFNANSYFHFHFNDEIPIWTMEFAWIPAPLADMIMPGATFLPGMNTPNMPERGKPFEQQISIQTPGVGRGWKDVVPFRENWRTFFNVEESIGTWFNIVPDWKQVAAAVKANPKRGRLFLPPGVEDKPVKKLR